jgi:chemotaxis protein methyltransferase CheR
MVRFERVNLMDGAQVGQLGTFDAVFCRNVLIYFQPDSRRRVIGSLADALKPGGHLFLGHSESLYRMSNEFEMVQFGRAIAYRKPHASETADSGER